jgi:hypothetical protein
VLSAGLGGIDLPSRRLDEQEEVRGLLEDGVAPLLIRFTVGPSPRRPATLFQLVDEGENGALAIGVDRADVWVSLRYRADDFRLSRPTFTVPGALRAFAEGDTVTLALSSVSRSEKQLSVSQSESYLLGITAGRAWSLLRFPRRIPVWSLPFVDLLWLSIVFAPLGWWALDARARLLGLIPLGALLCVPWFVPFLATPLSQYAAAAGGMMGATFFRSVARRPRPA